MENETPKKSSGLSHNLWVIIGVLLIITVVIVVVVIDSYRSSRLDPSISDPRQEIAVEDDDDRYALDDLEAELPVYSGEETPVVPGGSSVVDNQVVDREGQAVKSDVTPMSPGAPQQSVPLDREELDEDIIKLEISSVAGWVPNQFTVTANSAITLSVTGVDDRPHIFRFLDPSLEAVRIGVSSGETRAITFPTPSNPGEYDFECYSWGHARRGEVGVMIVE